MSPANDVDLSKLGRPQFGLTSLVNNQLVGVVKVDSANTVLVRQTVTRLEEMYAVSPLRYPGAKWRLDGFVEALLQDNGLATGHYAEPYAGGASLALSLMYRGSVSEIHLNDFDRSVWAFWKCATEHSAELIERVREAKLTIDEWHAQRDVQAQKKTASIVDLGFSTFFMNRTNRSGILTAGVIGGKEQLGPWKLDARFNKANLIERLQRVARHRSQIHVTRLDALTFTRRRSSMLPPKKSLVYLDPPYFVKGQELYMNAYEEGDHADLAHAVRNELRLPWLVSYDDVPQIRRLYSAEHRTSYMLRYSASSTRKGRELIFARPGLKLRPELLTGA